MSLALYGSEEEHGGVRYFLVEDILAHPSRYNISLTLGLRHQLRLIKHPHTMPIFECIQAFSNYIGAPVFVYEEHIGFIKYCPTKSVSQKTPCYLRSYDGVYFTLLRPDNAMDLEACEKNQRQEQEIAALHVLEEDTEGQVSMIRGPIDFVDAPQCLLVFRSCIQSDDSNLISCLQEKVNFDVGVEAQNTKKFVTFGSVVEIADLDSGMEKETPWREAFNVEVIKEWQANSAPLMKLRKLFHEFSGDKDRIKEVCLKLKYLRKYARHVPHIVEGAGGAFVRRIAVSGSSPVFPYLVPFAALGDIVKRAHSSNGHVGQSKLKRLVLPYIFHPNLYIVVQQVTRTCEQCLRNKPYSTAATPPVHRITTKRPFELVSVVLMELPHSMRQFKYVINAIDHHTKWLSSLPIKDRTSITCALGFSKILAGLPSIPESVLSDNGREFTGQAFS